MPKLVKQTKNKVLLPALPCTSCDLVSAWEPISGFLLFGVWWTAELKKGFRTGTWWYRLGTTDTWEA